MPRTGLSGAGACHSLFWEAVIFEYFLLLFDEVHLLRAALHVRVCQRYAQNAGSINSMSAHGTAEIRGYFSAFDYPPLQSGFIRRTASPETHFKMMGYAIVQQRQP